MKFSYPGYLSFLILIPAILIFYFLLFKLKKKMLLTFAGTKLLYKLVSPEVIKIQKQKSIILIFALLFLILGLSGPQIGSKLIEVRRKGIDIIIAIDCSNSMRAEDIKPNRLQRAKYELASLIDKLQGDRVGIIVFAGTAFLQCPLTTDYSAAKMLLDIIDPDLLPVQGTAIGTAIRLAIKSFSQKERKYKALILLTDGEETANSDPENAAQEAKKEGIRIYTIGYGSVEGELIPIKDEYGNIKGYKKDKKGDLVVSRLDETLLQKIALITDGKYYRATNGEIAVDYILEDISRMEKKLLHSRYQSLYEDRFQYFILISILLLFIELVLPERKFQLIKVKK